MFVTNEGEWNNFVMGQRESEVLDFKKGMTPKLAEIALDIADKANAAGGVLAYGADEGTSEGVKIAMETFDLGPTEPLVTKVEDAMHNHLYGLEPKPGCVQLRLNNGHRVLAVNIRPSLRLVGFHDPSERERVRYAVRVGIDRRYLRPDEVERRILTYSDHRMRLRIDEQMQQLGSRPGVHLRLLSHADQHKGTPTPWTQGRVEVERLEATGVALRFADGRQSVFTVPYDWITTVWRHRAAAGMSAPETSIGLLVAARLGWERDAEGGSHIVGVPVPWPR
ncbi:MAG: hypothetical protein JKY37_06095 [Nannocystaceae bacterium]|nr:hypothetical protein [Nannocystaceae bacterium]